MKCLMESLGGLPHVIVYDTSGLNSPPHKADISTKIPSTSKRFSTNRTNMTLDKGLVNLMTCENHSMIAIEQAARFLLDAVARAVTLRFATGL